MPLSRETEQILLQFFKSTELCKTLFIDSHIGFLIGRRETGQLLVVNNTYVELTGYSRNELLKMRYRDLVPKESVPWIREVIMAKLESETASDVFEHRIVQKTGGQLWLQSRIYKLDGGLALIKAIDVTQSKVTEAELTRSLNLRKKELPDSISGTEREVARLVASGLSSKEISDHIHLASRTIDNHRSSIRRKLKLRNTFTLRDKLQCYKF